MTAAALQDDPETARFTRWSAGGGVAGSARLGESSLKIGGIHCASCADTLAEALLAVDGKLLFSLVNAYYGGGARVGGNTARETLTPTEQRLNRIVVDLLADHFRRALAPVVALDFQHAQSETNASFVNMATPSETIVDR